MSGAAGVVSSLLLAISVGLIGLCVVGMVRAKDAFSRLHFPGAAILAGLPGIALALTIADGMSPTTVRAWLIFALLVATNGIQAHATARAELIRRRSDDERSRDEEG